MRAIIAPVIFFSFSLFPQKTRSDSICFTWIDEIDRQIACHLKIDHRWWWRTFVCVCAYSLHTKEKTKLCCFKQISYSYTIWNRSITNDRVACPCYHKFCSFFEHHHRLQGFYLFVWSQVILADGQALTQIEQLTCSNSSSIG